MVEEHSPWQMGTSIQDITLPDGTMYVGKWKNGLKHGQGTYTYSNGGKYFGKFKDGEKIFGVLGRMLGDRYWGTELEWYEEEDEKKDYTYVGEIKNGKPNGRGTFRWLMEGKTIGFWKNGKIWNGRETNLDGTHILRIVNGKEIKQ